MNDGEGEKCIAIAKCAWEAGDKEKALKWVHKSIRLYPSDEAKALAAYYTHTAPSTNNTGKSAGLSKTTANSARSSAAAGSSSSPRAQKPTYTAEQEQLAASIVRAKDHYSVLGLQRDATDAQIKSAYRKMAVKIHPDKNTAPSAEEAFKKVNAANECLSDASRRRR